MSGKRGETFVMHEPPGAEGAPSAAPLAFGTFILGLASTALIHLGVTPNPETGRAERDLALARQSLDLLGLLRDKTRGNLTEEEERLFAGILTELRLRYVEATKG